MDKKAYYEIIYKVYFYLDNYKDVHKMFFLDKYFLYNYLYRYKAPYKHKFRILFNNLFPFLNLLQTTNLTVHDMHFLIGSDCEENCSINNCMNDITYKGIIKKDMYQIYGIYKNALYSKIREWANDVFQATSSAFVVNLVLSQGPYHIDRVIKIEFKKKIGTLAPKIQNRNELSDNFLTGPSSCLKLTIDDNMKLIWPDSIAKYLLLRYNFDTFEEFFY